MNDRTQLHILAVEPFLARVAEEAVTGSTVPPIVLSCSPRGCLGGPYKRPKTGPMPPVASGTSLLNLLSDRRPSGNSARLNAEWYIVGKLSGKK